MLYDLVVWLSRKIDVKIMRDLLEEITARLDASQVLTWALDWYLLRIPAPDRLAALMLAIRKIDEIKAAFELEASEERRKLELLKD